MLEQGRTEPILKPVRRRGRAPSSHTYDTLRGHAAATVHLLVQTGLARLEAHQTAATQLNRLGGGPERASGAGTATTGRNWCRKVRSGGGRRGRGAHVNKA